MGHKRSQPRKPTRVSKDGLNRLAGELTAMGWTLDREITTLVRLSRSHDPEVSIRATGALARVLSDCIAENRRRAGLAPDALRAAFAPQQTECPPL